MKRGISLKRRVFSTKNEEKYQRLIQMTSEGYWRISPQFQTMDVNRALSEMLGYEREEMLERSIFDFVDEENRHVFLSSTTRMTEQDHRSYEIILRKKTGEEVYCFFNATTIRDRTGQVEGSFAFVTDITERKRSEEALKSSQRQLADIIDFLPDATVVIDTEGKIIAWNKEIEKMTGYKAEDMLGKGNYEYALPFYGERRPIIVDLVLLPRETLERDYFTIARDGDMLRGESTVTVVRGETRHLSAWARPIYDAAGQIIGAIECIRDVTELDQYRLHLEEMIEQRTIELKQAKEAAEAAAKAKSEFLANMSHEIRTPMNAILGFSGLVLKTDLSAKQRDYISKIDTSAKSLLGIINDILDFSKIEAGKLSMESIDFRLDEVINNIANMVSVKAAEKGIELLETIAEDVPYALVGDPLRLGQVLLNLANNAVKFTDQGHILIRAELLEKDEAHCRIKFSVKDTGIGMTEEQMGKLFQAFSQADSSVTRKYGGSGLGLTICRRLVEMMDGEISVTSEAGVGSTFTVTAGFRRQREDREQRFAGDSDVAGLKVLVVDDNELAREVLVEQLAAFKIEAVAVPSSEAAFRELRRAAAIQPYDLVLMDWMMPGMDGIEAAKVIMGDNQLATLPMIIMVTAFGREEVMKKAEKAGINAFLMKPVNQSLLFDTIIQAFGRNINRSDAGRPDLTSQDFCGGIEGAKILLVEDVPLNQQVAVEILESAGLAVELANNGQEAVKAVAGGQYDLVLMDVQMPVMGGYEATRLIRSDPQNAGLPIIAMTAHAIQGVREECLQAGMNDYVTKPIDPERLFEVLGRWLANQPGTPKSFAVDNSLSSPQLPGINTETGLKRLNGNTKLYRELLLQFADTYSSAVEDIRSAVSSGDPDVAQRLAHSLKGVAGNISADGIQEAAQVVELGIGQAASGELDRLLTRLDEELQRVLVSLKSLEQGQANPPGIPDALEEPLAPAHDEVAAAGDFPPENSGLLMSQMTLQEIAPLMLELENQIEENSFMAGDTFAKIEERLGGKMEEEIKSLKVSLDNFDFEGALTIIRVLNARFR